MIGLARFSETLVGSYRFVPGCRGSSEERPLSLEMEGRKAGLIPGLGGDVGVRGSIDARGLADARPATGQVRFSAWVPFGAEYRLRFSSNDGEPLELRATRKLVLRDAWWSASTVVGEILDAKGSALASLELRVDYRQKLRWLLPG